MTKFQRGFHSLLISFLFSLVNWVIVDSIVIEIPLYKYLLIEVMIVVSMRLYLFIISKTDLQ